MTTTVTVKARAWGALVVIATAAEGEEGHNMETQEIELGSNEERSFNLDGRQTITVHNPQEAPASNLPETAGSVTDLSSEEAKDEVRSKPVGGKGRKGDESELEPA